MYVLEGIEMNEINSVSIIIPLSRPTAYLKEILKLESKLANEIEFVLVIDNPKNDFIEWVKQVAIESKQKTCTVVNEENLGAPKSRNKGIEKAKGDLLLFLDDDVIPDKMLIDYHIEALKENESFGVIGTTIMDFQKEKKLQYAVGKAGFEYSFRLYQDYKKHSWGPTCNISFLKKKIGEIRFDDCYPKSGGGEDVDFCWDIVKANNNQKMIVCEKAKVIHPPWEGIKSIYRRLKRWGYADAILFNRQPERKYLDWPTYLGINILLTLATIVLGAIMNPWFFILIPLHLMISYFLTGIYQMYYCKSNFLTGQIIQSLRIWHHIGRMQKTLSTFKIHQLLNRTQYFDDYTPKKIRKKTFIEFLLIIISFTTTLMVIYYLLYWK